MKKLPVPLLLFLIMLLGLGVRLYRLDTSSIWADEAFSWFYSQNSLSYLWSMGMWMETNPPGFYTFLHFWQEIFGSSPLALRFPEVLASTLCIFAVYLLGRELEGPVLGLTGALILSLAPTEIWYAQEARVYAFLHLADAVILLALARFLRKPRRGDGLILYALGAAISIYLHGTAVFFIAACNLAVLFAILGRTPLIDRRAFVSWIAANAVVAVLALPQVFVMANQVGSPNLAWYSAFTWRQVPEQVCAALRGPASDIESVHGYASLLLGGLVFAYIWARPYSRRTLTILLLPLLAFILILIAASQKQPIFHVRSLCWLWIPFSLLLAVPLIRPGAGRWILLPFLLLFFICNLSAQFFPKTPLKQSWVPIMAEYLKEAPRKEPVIINPRQLKANALIYHCPEIVNQILLWDQDVGSPIDFGSGFVGKKMHLTYITLPQIQALIASGQPVSLVLSRGADSTAGLPSPSHRLTVPVRGPYEIEIWSWNRPIAAGK